MLKVRLAPTVQNRKHIFSVTVGFSVFMALLSLEKALMFISLLQLDEDIFHYYCRCVDDDDALWALYTVE